MKFKQIIFATGTILLVSIASVFAAETKCYQPGFSPDDPVCRPGTNLLFTLFYRRQNTKTGWCCPPGHPEEKSIMTRNFGCQTKEWTAPGVENSCARVQELWLNGGEKIKFDDEVKREAAVDEKYGDVGEATYCCQKGSLPGSLASMYGAEVNEFPHMARLNLGEKCGGTIYNKRYIITAAHCIIDQHSKQLRPIQASWNIKVGNTLTEAENNPNEYKIVEAIPYPEYSNWERSPELTHEKPQGYNDISLLKVDRDIVFGDTVKSLQIAPKGFDELEYADRVVVPGWGTTDTGAMSTNLQKSNFVLRSDKTCFSNGNDAAHPLQFNHTERLMCIGGVWDGIWSPTAGSGDSGGPAICRGAEGTPVHCGIGSYIDSTCADVTDTSKCVPNVFTEVDFFEDWVKGIAGKQDSSTFYKPQLYGEVVKGNKVEHQVRITSATGKSCGGTLVKPDIVVTAASCVASDDGSKKILSGLKVWTGVRDISGGGSQGEAQEANVVEILNGFKRVGDPVNIEAQGNRIRQTDNYYSNNLAVIKLQKPVNVNPNKLPKLPGSTQKPSTMAMEYAFPRNTSRGGEMRQREFTTLSNDECRKRYARLEYVKMTSKVEDNMLCAVEKYSGGSLCDRELGGGLVCKGDDGQDTLCGVQAYRMCEWQIPNQFVNVAKESDWVQSTIAGLQ